MKIVMTTLAALAVSASAAFAQTYPSQPVRVIVPFAAGGGAAVIAQVLGVELSNRWGQQAVIDNRPGAGGNLGAELAAEAPADGYTLLFSTQSFAVNDSLSPSAVFKPAEDFEPVVLVGKSENVVLTPASLAPNTVAELVELSKQPNANLNYASTGNGTIGHLASELFKGSTGLVASHIPYSSISQATTDVIAGRVQIWITSIAGKSEYVSSGQMKALAVSGTSRSPLMPDVPTLDEAGVPGYSASSWYAVWAPKGTPTEVLDKLNADFNAALESPEVRQQIESLGAQPMGGTRAELATFLEAELEKWASLVKASAITAN